MNQQHRFRCLRKKADALSMAKVHCPPRHPPAQCCRLQGSAFISQVGAWTHPPKLNIDLWGDGGDAPSNSNFGLFFADTGTPSPRPFVTQSAGIAQTSSPKLWRRTANMQGPKQNEWLHGISRGYPAAPWHRCHENPQIAVPPSCGSERASMQGPRQNEWPHGISLGNPAARWH